MHFLGMAGMPRRISDYPDNYYGWNCISSYGSTLSFLSAFFFMFIVYTAMVSGRKGTRNT